MPGKPLPPPQRHSKGPPVVKPESPGVEEQLPILFSAIGYILALVSLMLVLGAQPHDYAVDRFFGFPTRPHVDRQMIWNGFLALLFSAMVGTIGLAINSLLVVNRNKPWNVSLIVLAIGTILGLVAFISGGVLEGLHR